MPGRMPAKAQNEVSWLEKAFLALFCPRELITAGATSEHGGQRHIQGLGTHHSQVGQCREDGPG